MPSRRCIQTSRQSLRRLEQCDNPTCDFPVVVKANPDTPCSQANLTGNNLLACQWMEATWDYWRDSYHGTYARESYDAIGADDASGHSGRVFMALDYTFSKDVLAHENGHFLVSKVIYPVPTGGQVVEHLADVHSMAVDNDDWKLPDHPTCTIRDWQDPRSVTTRCTAPYTARFPNTFDEYNDHSLGGAGTRPGYYTSPHVGSTYWSHMIYRLANKPGIGRTMALEQPYRALVKYMDEPDDLEPMLYALFLRAQASSGDFPIATQMQQVQDEVGIWHLAEYQMSNVYSRPGVARGWVGFAEYLQVFYNKYVPGVLDELRVAKRAYNGTWTEESTGVSPSTVSSGIAAAVDSANTTVLAWRRYDGRLMYVTRPWLGSWSSVQEVPNSYSTHEPALAAGGSTIRLYYRNSGDGRLRYFKWNGSGWSGPAWPAGNPQMAKGPSATWDGTRFLVSYIGGSSDQPGQVGVLEATPASPWDTWSSASTLSTCTFNTNPHNWNGPVSSEFASGKLYLVGVHAAWSPYGQQIAQAVVKKEGGSWVLKDHSGVQIIGDAVDTDVAWGSVFTVDWLWSQNGWSSAAVYAKPVVQ